MPHNISPFFFFVATKRVCRAARELWTFWSDMSVSMCMEDKPPAVIDIVLSMSMSMDYGLAGLLPEDWEALWPDVGSMSSMSYGYGAVTLGDSPLDGLSVPPVVDDEPASSASTSGEAESSSAADDGSDSTAANVGKDTRASASSSASAPQTVLFIVLVGAAMAVLSAWYVRKNMRGASSNASMMTPVSAPLI